MTLHEIESAIAGLPPDELSKFRVWFAEFDAAAWDREFEDDVAARRLDSLADEALQLDSRQRLATDLRSGEG